jgi:hypothetical protein
LAEPVIESASPILMHGPVADAEVNAERVLAEVHRKRRGLLLRRR